MAVQNLAVTIHAQWDSAGGERFLEQVWNGARQIQEQVLADRHTLALHDQGIEFTRTAECVTPPAPAPPSSAPSPLRSSTRSRRMDLGQWQFPPRKHPARVCFAKSGSPARPRWSSPT